MLAFLIGKRTLYLRQWLYHDYNLARINGFSFEPSYFATYMLIGCFIWFILWIRNNDFIKYRGIILSTLGIVLFLSSSRIGWIGIIFIIAYGVVEFFGHFFIHKKFTKQNLKFFIYFLMGVLFVAAALIYISTNPERFNFLFQGTGLFNTADASYSMRFDRTIKTIEVFIDKPVNIILGVGPGGAGAYMVANPEKFNIYASGFAKLWSTEPNAIGAELLASVGVVGFMIFAWFIINIFKRLWNLYRNNILVSKYRTICLALFWGLVIELLILQLNQNYLRPYLWLHIGISIAVINTLEYLLKNKTGSVIISNGQIK
ncbi:O-antigen ligase family protein [Actinomycetota bacterium]